MEYRLGGGANNREGNAVSVVLFGNVSKLWLNLENEDELSFSSFWILAVSSCMLLRYAKASTRTDRLSICTNQSNQISNIKWNVTRQECPIFHILAKRLATHGLFRLVISSLYRSINYHATLAGYSKGDVIYWDDGIPTREKTLHLIVIFVLSLSPYIRRETK